MITLVRVRNYKSLANVGLTLKPLHVFVGPNNSGKSNLFDAFRFLRELMEIGEQAVHSRGGFSQIVWGGDIKRAISFELHMAPGNSRTRKNKLVYHLEISGGPQYFHVTRERLTAFDGKEGEKQLLSFPSANNRVSVTYVDGRTFELSRHDHLFDQFQDEQLYGPLAKFVNELKTWSFYNFEPSLMRRPNAVKQDFRFLPAGENLSAVIHSIQSEHAREFNEIQGLLKTALPELRRLFSALTKDGQTFVSLEEESMPMRVPVWAMSDGTLRLLGQLAALFSPERAALACFEEPENYLHPAWLPRIADVLKNAASKGQILISTHSPYLLSSFSPENLIVVEKHNGRTQLTAVKKNKELRDALQVLGLGEIWYSGELGGTP